MQNQPYHSTSTLSCCQYCCLFTLALQLLQVLTSSTNPGADVAAPAAHILLSLQPPQTAVAVVAAVAAAAASMRSCLHWSTRHVHKPDSGPSALMLA